jgi:succinate dehydrogenase/fumarate reductase flavoprotein subunit
MKNSSHSQSNILRESRSTLNKVVHNCSNERNQYIRRELADIIKKEVNVFFAKKKLNQELEEHQKDLVYV